MVKTYNVLLDTMDIVTNPAFTINTNDLKTIQLNILINQDKEALDLTGATVRLAIKKPDRTTVMQDCTIVDPLAGSCEIVLDTQAYVIAGDYAAEVMVYFTADTVAVTCNFTYTAKKGILDDGTVESTNEFQSINQLISDAQTAATNAETSATAAATSEANAAQTAQEAIQARTPASGTAFATLKARLDDSDELLTEKSQQSDLNNVVTFRNQNDFVTEIAKNINLSTATVAIDFGDPQRHFRLIQPVSSNQGVEYVFEKNQHDDFIMMLDGHIASLSSSELTSLSKNYDSDSGTGWVKTSPPSYYTTHVGDTFTFAFTGTGFNFNHFADNRGGVWEFVTTNSTGSVVSTVDISTYSATSATVNNAVVNGLPSGNYTVVATFKGDDPLHVPSGGAGTSRGWVVYETRTNISTKTLNILDVFINGTKTDDILYSYSNKEFALSGRPYGSGYAFNFVPEHNGIGTAFKVIDQQLMVNGNLMSWFVAGQYIKNVQSMQLIQKVQGKSPEDGQAFVEITIIHSYKNGVMSIQGKAKFLKQTEMDVGYGTMIPYFLSFSTKMKSSFANIYPTTLTDGSHTNLTTESDQATSFVFLNDTGKTNYVLAVTVDTPSKTFRYGETMRGNPFSWIENRNTTMGKVYFQPFQNAVVSTGYIFNFSSRFFVGIIPNIMDLML